MVYKIHPSRIIPGEDIFYLHDTKGFPYQESAAIAAQKRMVIDWPGFIHCAEAAGWNIKTLQEKIRAACLDAGYGPELMAEIEGLGMQEMDDDAWDKLDAQDWYDW